MKKKILIVFGTRPEAIKLAPLILKLKNESCFITKICVSGQHRDMLDGVLRSFGIIPDFDLSIMKAGQTLSYITSSVLSGIIEIIDVFSPNLIIVHGDTSTALSAALAGFYKMIPVVHIEAGLRSNDIFSPYPEEFNRRAISLIASIHFAPTEYAASNLKKEGIDSEKIFVVGNTVIDAILMNTNNSSDFTDAPFAIMTVHRRENSEKKLISIFSAIKKVIEKEQNFKIIYPVHKNPRISELAKSILGNTENIILCEPINVKEFHSLLQKCRFVITDSGGIQEEAAFLGKPVLVLRDNTERPEAAIHGTSRVIGTNESDIINCVESLLHNSEKYNEMAQRCFEFGDGHACEKIVEILKKY